MDPQQIEFFDKISKLPEDQRKQVRDSMGAEDQAAFDKVSGLMVPAKPNDYYEQILKLPNDQETQVKAAMHPEDAAAYERYKQLQAEKRAPAAAPAAPGGPQVAGQIVEKQGVPTYDRFVLQNFANDPAAAKAYLDKNHPELETALHYDKGQPSQMLPMGGARQEVVPGAAHPAGARVVMRPKGSNGPWNVIDPQTGIPTSLADLPEFGKDITDNAYAIPAGLLQGSASALGGVGGAALGGTAGALLGGGGVAPGAFLGAKTGAGLAGGAAAGGLEALKQGLGRTFFGIPQGMDPDAIKAAAVGGAVAPLLFGTGASTGTIAGEGLTGKLASKLGLTGGPATYASQRGLPGAALQASTPAMMSFFSGMPKKEIAQARELLPQMQDVEKKGLTGVMDVVRDAQDQTREALMSNQQKVGHDIMTTLANANKQVDIRPVKERLQGLIGELEASRGTRAFTANREAELEHVKGIYNDMLKPSPPQDVVKRMSELQQIIEDGKKPIPENTSPYWRGDAHPPQPDTTAAEAQLQALQQHWSTPPDFVHPLDAQRIKDDLGDLAQVRQGGDVYVGKKNFDKKVISAGSAARKDINTAIEEAVKDVDNSMGGKGVGPLWERYTHLKDTQAALEPFLEGDSGEKRAYTILRNLGAPANAPTRERLLNLDKEFGTKVVNNADLLNSLKIFSDPSNVALSGWGSTSTSRTGFARSVGAAGGGLLGTGAGAAISKLSGGAIPMHWAMGAGGSAGSGFGAAFGQKLWTPAAIRRYLNMGQTMRNASGFVNTVPGLGLTNLTNPLGADAMTSAWEHMNGR